MRILICSILLSFACISPASAQDYLWCVDADTVIAEVAVGSLTLHHAAAVYNCCADPFQYEVSHEAEMIVVRELEILANPCFCICCFNLTVEIADVPPGFHPVQFCWYDYETAMWQDRMLQIFVPGDDQGQPMTVTAVSEPECVTLTGVIDEGTLEHPQTHFTSWGLLKSRFR